MAQVLDIAAAVVTEEVLRQAHTGQQEIRVAPGALVTPSGWDFLRYHRLQLVRGGALGSATATSRSGSAAPAASATAASATAITEILPPGSEAGVLSRGRCDHPDKAFGCRTEEFGSGFVEPSSCSDCAIQQVRQVQPGGSNCGGCNKAPGNTAAGQRATGADDSTEALVQQLTDEIMRRLGTA